MIFCYENIFTEKEKEEDMYFKGGLDRYKIPSIIM